MVSSLNKVDSNLAESKLRQVSSIKIGDRSYYYFSLKALERLGHDISRLPITIRIFLESLIRNLDMNEVTETDVENLLKWTPENPGDFEIPFKVARVLMQDFTGVPAIVDLAAMREAGRINGRDPQIINPQIPVDLVIDHSVQVDFWGRPDALTLNIEKEFERNAERYRFLKWAQSSFKNLRIVAPSVGICHQVNLEYLAQVVRVSEMDGKQYAFPDTLVGTDSHTTMVNGIGVLGWGVGGIEAEAAMLGQPVTFRSPEVVGLKLNGRLREGVLATDLLLTIAEKLRHSNLVDKFVEVFGEGLSTLDPPTRATLSNMSPEYGCTAVLFPVDEKTLEYLRLTGRSEEHIGLVEAYLKEQGLFGHEDQVKYSEVIEVDLENVNLSVSGPRLPEQHRDLDKIGDSLLEYMKEGGRGDIHSLTRFENEGGPAVYASEFKFDRANLRSSNIILEGKRETLNDGDIAIAAITSCTNTSNPEVMVAAGLLARNAVKKGLRVGKKVKASLAPGSRVVSDYLQESGLQPYLDTLGFSLVGYGCTTCIGNSGPLQKEIEEAIVNDHIFTAAVLSGNRNFEARIHRTVKANYLMSPPLVVAFAIAGTVLIDLTRNPLGLDLNGNSVFLKDIWPSSEEIRDVIGNSLRKDIFTKRYTDLDQYNPRWVKLDVPSTPLYAWDEDSTYIRKPPFFEDFKVEREISSSEIRSARVLLVLGDSVSTDHISPAGSFGKETPAGKFLIEHGVKSVDFNSYGSRRGNHEVMARGTFANNRLRNLLVSREGGYTVHFPDKVETSVFAASSDYRKENTPLIVIAGQHYGVGSSRDWSAKGPYLLGVKAVIAQSYERIHRGNLVGMGVIPLQFLDGENFESLKLDPGMPIDISFPNGIGPGSNAVLRYKEKESHKELSADLIVRIETRIEEKYIHSGGILQYVLGRLLK